MNKIGKIASIVVILACIGSLFFAFRVNGLKTQLRTDVTKVTKDKEATQKQLDAKSQELVVKNDALRQAEDDKAKVRAELTATELARDKFKTEGEETKAKVAQLDQQAQESQAKLAANAEELKKLRAMAESPEVKNAEAVGKELGIVQDENKVISGQLMVLQGQRDQISKELVAIKETPAGLRGNVARVEEKWNFVVLNIGSEDRVHTNTQFVVYRDSKLISKVNVITVYDKTCIAKILPEYQAGVPHVGDVVIYGKM